MIRNIDRKDLINLSEEYKEKCIRTFHTATGISSNNAKEIAIGRMLDDMFLDCTGYDDMKPTEKLKGCK